MMTDGPQSAVDPVMAQALDWVLRVNDCPDGATVKAELTNWLAASEENAKAYRKAQRVWQLTGDVPPAHFDKWASQTAGQGPTRLEPNSPALGSNGRVQTGLGARRARSGRKWWIGLAGAACAASLAAFLLPNALLLIEADYRTSAGQIREISLPDGSVVTLGPSSALAVDFDASVRHVVLLSGEAFFKVVHDAEHPFTVEAAGLTARDIGTAFDIDIEPTNLDVAVQSGAVGLSFGGGSTEALVSGERITINRATRRAVRSQESVDAIAAWRSGRLIVDNVSIGDVVQQLRRYYKGYIWVRDPGLSDRRISGVYDLNDPVSALKAAVEPHAGVVTALMPFFLVVSAS